MDYQMHMKKRFIKALYELIDDEFGAGLAPQVMADELGNANRHCQNLADILNPPKEG